MGRNSQCTVVGTTNCRPHTRLPTTSRNSEAVLNELELTFSGITPSPPVCVVLFCAIALALSTSSTATASPKPPMSRLDMANLLSSILGVFRVVNVRGDDTQAAGGRASGVLPILEAAA